MEEHLLGEVILLHGSKYLEGLVSSSRLGDILGSPKTKGGETRISWSNHIKFQYFIYIKKKLFQSSPNSDIPSLRYHIHIQIAS